MDVERKDLVQETMEKGFACIYILVRNPGLYLHQLRFEL